MKPTLTLLTALLLAPLAALLTERNLPGVPRFGKISAVSFQALEIFGAPASNDWN
jgi:hypothetical protein